MPSPARFNPPNHHSPLPTGPRQASLLCRHSPHPDPTNRAAGSMWGGRDGGQVYPGQECLMVAPGCFSSSPWRSLRPPPGSSCPLKKHQINKSLSRLNSCQPQPMPCNCATCTQPHLQFRSQGIQTPVQKCDVHQWVLPPRYTCPYVPELPSPGHSGPWMAPSPTEAPRSPQSPQSLGH